MTEPMVPDEINVDSWREGFHLFFPMRGSDHWRVVGILPPELRGRDDLAFDEVIPIRREAGSGLSFQKCSWLSTYRIHHRSAERFRNGRRSARRCRTHRQPGRAQGMNTGLQDAYNLGWKPALVVSGGADAALLDSTKTSGCRSPGGCSRRPTAPSLVVSDKELAGLFRTRVVARILAAAMSLARINDWHFARSPRSVSPTRIAPCPKRSRACPPARRARATVPWPRLKLSADGPAEDLFEGSMTPIHPDRDRAARTSGRVPGHGDLLVIPEDPANDRELARADIPRQAFYLLRPDGDVGSAEPVWKAGR